VSRVNVDMSERSDLRNT